MIELEAYLPVCSKCGKALRLLDKPVTLPCCHLYCRRCVDGLDACYLDQGTTIPIVDFTEQVQKLIESYGTETFQTELTSFREAINVNLVNCPRGNDCRIRSECPYCHLKVIPAESSFTEWKCSGCNVMVENKACPFCRREKPIQSPGFDSRLYRRTIWTFIGIGVGLGLLYLARRLLRSRRILTS